MTSVWTTSGPKLLAQVTGFRVSMYANKKADFFQTVCKTTCTGGAKQPELKSLAEKYKYPKSISVRTEVKHTQKGGVAN